MHKAQSDRSEGRLAQNTPRSRSSLSHGHLVWPKVLLCVMALWALLASSASGQVLERTILLPDSLGPLPGATHVVLDESPAHPRMFVGSEDGDVLVVDSRTGARVARVETGPVKDLCYSPVRNRLYVSITNPYGFLVVDCGSYQVTKQLPMPYVTTGLLYNPLLDRIYCATWGMRVIDCATDSIVDSLPMYTKDAIFALDTLRNRLYIGAVDTFRVVDCSADTIVASIYELRGAEAVCFAPSPSGGKVYVGVDDTLFALTVNADTIVYRQGFTSPFTLACDPERGRIYFAQSRNLIALNCANDSIIWTDHVGAVTGLAAAPAENKVYALLGGDVRALNGETGQQLQKFEYFDYGGLHYSALLNRLFLTADGGGEDNTRAIDCGADSVTSVIPLGAYVGYFEGSVCLDSADNKLYFSAGASGVGVVDCQTNKVTSYICASREPYPSTPPCLVYNAHGNRLYIRRDTSLFVVDCRADTVLKVIPVGAFSFDSEWQMELNPDLDKLYVLTSLQTSYRLVVVDCTADTVSQVLELPGWVVTDVFMSPELNQLWFLHEGYTVIDCVGDSVLVDTNPQLHLRIGSYDPSNRKVYAASDTALFVIDMDTRLPLESLSIPHTDQAWTGQVYCARQSGKVYWSRQYPEYLHEIDSVFAVDTRMDSIVSIFTVPFMSDEVCEDRTGNYVYFASGYLLAVDTHTDSIVSGVRLPIGANFIVRNGATNRIYFVGDQDSVMQVIYDSIIFAGVQARQRIPTQAPCLQTLLSRSTPLRSTTEAVLFDASGRRAAMLRFGPNDVSHLAPGVYFVREGLQTSSRKPEAVRKIVIAE
jgi:DNA-binding beta-propeller fold protein YncE